MKLTLTLLAGMLMSGWETPNKAADGYNFEQKEFTNTNIHIEFVVHQSYDELREAAKFHGIKRYMKIRAFSELKSPYYDTCVVHIIDPDIHYAPEYIGHEITHCIYGRWHDYKKDGRENLSPSRIKLSESQTGIAQ